MKELHTLDDEDLSLFPSYEEYKSELSKLDNFPFDESNNHDIYNMYFDYAKILPNNYKVFKKKEFNKYTFYRTRLNIDAKKENLSLIDTYSYPPRILNSKNQRANLKNTSVFYSSDNPVGAILETKPKINDEGFLSIWKGDAQRNLKAGYCLPNYLPKNNNWSKVAIDILEYNQKISKKKYKSKFKHLLLLNRFISHKFITEEEPYHITSMISNELLFGDDLWRDFLVYPSVASNKNMCNIVFHPNSMNENIKFDKVIRYKINDIEDEIIKFQLGKTGVLMNNKIEWRKRTKEETNLFVN